jgi:repressor LexA
MEIIQDLTGKQRNVLLFIQDRIKQNGIAPTIREIAANFGFSSTGTVRDYLKALTRKGYLNIEPRKSRHIAVKRHQGFKIPILGQVMAGVPNLALEDVEEYLDLDDFSAKPDREIFCLRIKGDSLKDLGIFAGDLALVRKQRLADDGDLVVALIGDEAAAKIFRHKNNRAWLEAANKKYPPIKKEFSVIGRVFTVLKQF